MSLSTLSWRNDEYHLQDVDQQQCWLEISTLSTQYLHGIIFIYKRSKDVLSQSKCSREGGDCSDKSSTQAHPLPMASSLYAQLWLLMLMMLVDAQIESRFSSIHDNIHKYAFVRQQIYGWPRVTGSWWCLRPPATSASPWTPGGTWSASATPPSPPRRRRRPPRCSSRSSVREVPPSTGWRQTSRLSSCFLLKVGTVSMSHIHIACVRVI